MPGLRFLCGLLAMLGGAILHAPVLRSTCCGRSSLWSRSAALAAPFLVSPGALPGALPGASRRRMRRLYLR